MFFIKVVSKLKPGRRPSVRNLLDISVGADDVLDLIGVRVLEGEAAGSNQHPLSVFHSEAIHD